MRYYFRRGESASFFFSRLRTKEKLSPEMKRNVSWKLASWNPFQNYLIGRGYQAILVKTALKRWHFTRVSGTVFERGEGFGAKCLHAAGHSRRDLFLIALSRRERCASSPNAVNFLQFPGNFCNLLRTRIFREFTGI